MTNKNVLITGASSGIGAALARNFSISGNRVIMAARREDRLKGLKDELTQAGAKVLAIRTDISNTEDLTRLREQAHQEFGLLDIVIANAAIPISGKFEALSITDYRREFEINVFGLLQTCYTFLNDLKKTKGTLVLIGSTASYMSSPGSSAYAMSKFAVRAFAEALRPELAADGVKVVLINPGFIQSDLRHIDNRGIFHPESKDWAPAWLVMSAQKAAVQIIKAISRGKREKFITWHAYFGYFIRQYTPGLYFTVVQSMSKRYRRSFN